MKILLISSSPHRQKSRTFLLASEVLRGVLDKSGKSEIIHLADCRISFCRHCEECHKKIMRCAIKDGAAAILKKMLEADGIILASPNYINQVTGSMKTLFDRSSHFIHCKRLLDKYVVGVVSSGSGQDKDVLDYIKYYSFTCGAQYSGGVSSCAYSIQKKIGEAFNLGRKLVADIKEKKTYPEQLELMGKDKQHFRRIIEARKNEWKEEYQYWKDKGWL